MKKFHFRLQPVLQAQEFRLAELLAQHREIERFLEQARNVKIQFALEITREEEAWHQAFLDDPGDRHLFMGRQQTLDSRARLFAVADERIEELEKLLESNLEAVNEARREVSRLEKVRERMWNEYLSDLRRQEQKELDELSLQRFGRPSESSFS